MSFKTSNRIAVNTQRTKPAKRLCLKCGCTFNSTDCGNRICTLCKVNANSNYAAHNRKPGVDNADD